MRAEQELERSGNDGPEAVADSVPVRRASQGTDSSKALQGGGAAGAREEEEQARSTMKLEIV